MSHLLDTNACIHFLNGSRPALVERVLAAGPQHVVVSALSVAELEFGAARSSRPAANAERLRAFLREIHVEPFHEGCSPIFGQIKAALVGAGTPIADLDIAIAATAMAMGMTVVTDDGDFSRIAGLRVENWSS